MKNKELLRYAVFSLFLIVFAAMATTAQTAEITYQGSLKDGPAPANGNYDFEFKLYDALSGGTLIGSRQRAGVQVANGTFAVMLDFLPSAFGGENRFLEMGVRPAGGGGYQQLLPRQLIRSTPYAYRSLSSTTADAANTATTAATATNALQLGGVAAAQYVLTGDPRLSDARPPTGGSTFYIQNNPVLQQAASFNVSGNGIVGGTFQATGAINTVTQYNLAGSRILSIGPSDSLFVGLGAGANNTGAANSFFGRNSGNANTSGADNSFFGRDAGLSNTLGSRNSYFGRAAGQSNLIGLGNAFFGFEAGRDSTADFNAFFGSQAGQLNTSGERNAFFGNSTGAVNTAGSRNAFFGQAAGISNIGGSDNSFFGRFAGSANTGGSDNVFVGTSAGLSNTTGNFNTAIGYLANVGYGSGNLTYATAIGADASVSTSNTIQLGRTDGNDTVLVPGKLQIDTLATTGTTNLCLNFSNRVSPCSSSLRYKTNISPFVAGLDLLNRLRPITFNWKDGGMADLGLGAEDVAKIEPLLVTYNKAGQVEGVKYDRVGVVLINAVREQQAQIEQQQTQIQKEQQQLNQQQLLIDGLKKLLCQSNPQAEVCKEEIPR